MRLLVVSIALVLVLANTASAATTDESVADIFDTVKERLNDPENTPDAIDSVSTLVAGIRNRLTNEQAYATRDYQSSVMETTAERQKLQDKKDEAVQNRLNFEASLVILRGNVTQLQSHLDTLDDRIREHADALGVLDVKLDKGKILRRTEMLRFVRRKKHTLISLAKVDKVIDLLGFEKPEKEENEKMITLKQKLDILHEEEQGKAKTTVQNSTQNATAKLDAEEQVLNENFIELESLLEVDAKADDLEPLRVLLIRLYTLLHAYIRDIMETESAAAQVFKNRRIVWEEQQHEHREAIEKLEGSRLPTQQNIARIQSQISEIDPFKISKLTREAADYQKRVEQKEQVLASLGAEYEKQKEQRDRQLATVEQMESQIATHRGLRPNFYNAAAKNGSSII